MVRTKERGFQPEGHRRPTTSARRRDRGALSSAPPVGGDAPLVGGDAPPVGGDAPSVSGAAPPIGGAAPYIDGGDAGEVVSARRGDRGASSSASHVGGDAPPVGGDALPVSGDAPCIDGGNAGEVVGFSGGPSDVSLLVSYNHHVALRLWEGQVRLCYNLCLFCV